MHQAASLLREKGQLETPITRRQSIATTLGELQKNQARGQVSARRLRTPPSRLECSARRRQRAGSFPVLT